MYLAIRNQIEKKKIDTEKKPYRADSLAFLAPQGKPPVLSSLRPQLDLALLTSVPPSVKDFGETLAEHCMFRIQTISNKNVREVLGKSDLDCNKGDIHILFGLQHAPSGMTLRKVKRLREHNIFTMTLAFDGPSEYGCGFASERDTGLTDKGRTLLENMSAVEMCVDLSHAGHKTAGDALEFIRQKKLLVRPIVTHGGCYAVYPHKRNLPDDILKEVAQMGGYVGISLITFLLGAKGSDELEEFVQHVKHAIYVCGEDAVGVGSDCPHMDMSRINAQRNYKRLTGKLKTNGKFGERFPDRPERIYREGGRMFEILQELLLKECDPDIIDLTREAVEITPDIKKKVLGLNFRNFVERSLPK